MRAIRPSVLAQELVDNINAGQPVMIWGPPGIGKSALVSQAAKKLERPHIDLRANLLDPTDLRGFPHIKDGRACWAPPIFLPTGEDQAFALLNIEELPTAMPATQTALYQLVLDYRIGEAIIPRTVAMVATGNRQVDRAATYNMPTPLKNRFAHYLLETNLEDWLEWAFANGIDSRITSFLQFRPDALYQFDANVEAFPTPRTWEKLSRRLAHSTDTTMFLAAASLVGDGTGGEFSTYCKVYLQLPKIDDILSDPDSVPVPKHELSVLYAICGALAEKANRKTFGAILKYVSRMQEEYQVLTIKESIRRTPNVTSSPEYVAWAVKNAKVVL